MNALANMGANMSAMLSGTSPLTETQSDNAEGAEIGAVEMPPPSEREGGSKTDPPTPIEVNIDIDKTQGNAIYSSLLGLQNTLDNFQLDVKQDSLREVVCQAIKDAVEEHLTEGDKAQQEKEEELRAEGKPATAFEAYQMATNRNTDAINKFNHNSDVIKKQYKNISDLLCELLGRVNLYPYEKPKFKDESGHILLNSLYLYPWFCFKCFYSSKHVRVFFKTIAWSIWLISICLTCIIAHDNAKLHTIQKKYVLLREFARPNQEWADKADYIEFLYTDEAEHQGEIDRLWENRRKRLAK